MTLNDANFDLKVNMRHYGETDGGAWTEAIPPLRN